MPANDDLRFFATVCASITHELKNVLAVIHEQAGLLDDLTHMAARGMPLDPERLAATSDCLLRQVGRGDAILTDLNKFAHATDAAESPIHLEELVPLAVSLSQRRAAMRKVRLDAGEGAAAAISGDPFLAIRLLAGCLDRAMDAPDADKTVTMAVTTADAPTVTVAGMADDAPGDVAALEALAAPLGARLEPRPGGLAVIWPTAS